MDELKIKVVQKQLDGSTEISDVTFSDDNEVTSEISIEPGENSVVANPEIPAGTTPTDLETVKIGRDYYEISGGGGGGSDIDADVTVEIENDYTNDNYLSRTNYADPISLKDFIINCESGIYTNPGTIAKVNNMIDGHGLRIILIGTNHDVLAIDGVSTAKTTWQFLDLPVKGTPLGLPFDFIDIGSGGRGQENTYLDGTNAGQMMYYPSNRGGYATASSLLEDLRTVYDSLPVQLKRSIKTTKVMYNVLRTSRKISANGSTETDSVSEKVQIAQKLFCLSCNECGKTSTSEGGGSLYDYLNNTTRRIRYYAGEGCAYWLRTSQASSSNNWAYISSTGDIYYGTTTSMTWIGIAPAFCI